MKSISVLANHLCDIKIDNTRCIVSVILGISAYQLDIIPYSVYHLPKSNMIICNLYR